MDAHDYRIERMDESRFKDMDELYLAVYGRNKGEAFFSGKYNTSYTGVAHLGYLAYDGSTPVAFYGVIPCFISFESTLVLCAQSADTMTHPMHRYKGLFAQLARLTYALCKQSAIKFVFGFPNQFSHHGLSKTLEWEQTETLDSFTIPVNRAFLAKATKKFLMTRPIFKAYSKSILRPYQIDANGIPNSVLGEGYGGVYRDAAYLNYKKYSETIVMAIGRSRVWVRMNEDLWIGDIAGVESNEELRSLIDKLTFIAKRFGINRINFQISPGTALHKLFVSNYQPSPSFATMFLDLGARLPFEKIKFTLADIDIF